MTPGARAVFGAAGKELPSIFIWLEAMLDSHLECRLVEALQH